MRQRSWIVKTAATTCALALAVAACGGDDDDDTAATTPATETSAPGATEPPESPDTTAGEPAESTTPGTDGTAGTTAAPGTTEPAAPEQTGEAAGTTIKIGLLYSETGRTASSYNTSDDVALAWTAHANSTKNGANGHPVEVIAYDVASDVAVAAEKAREAVEVDGVAAVIIQDSNTEIAVREYLAAQGVPVIGGSSNAFVEAPNTEFVLATTPPAAYAAQGAAAQALGATSFSALVCSEVPSCGAAAPFYEEYIESTFGLAYVPLALASHTETSYTAPCLSLVGQGADYMVLGFAAAIAPVIAEECVLQGFSGYFGFSSNSVAGPLADVGLPMAGYLNGFPWWADDPAVEEFNTVLADAAPDVDVRNPAATITWASLELLRKAFIDYGPASDAEVGAPELLATYYQVHDESLGGLLPMPVTYTEGDTNQPTVDCAYLWSLEAGGEFETLPLGDSGNGATGDLQSWCWEG